MAKKTYKAELVKILASECDTNKGIVRLVQLWDFNGRKFRFTFENSNGTPCGFDYKHCVDVFNVTEDAWKHIGDKRDILAFAKGVEIDCVNYYGNSRKLIQSAQYFMDACLEYVKALYL